MFWVIVCTVLAAAGLFAAGWALFGWCVLPQRREAVTVYRLQACEPQLERQVRAFVWARESGLAAGRLVLAGGEETPETEALARQLAQKILPPGAKTVRLTQAQLADVRRLAAELYQSWDWTWGKTPAFTYEKTAEFAGRPIRVRYEARHGLIRNAAVQSDAIDAARASALLEGARLDPALFLDVCRALAGERAAELFDIFM